MKRGGSLENKIMYYTVVVIAILNLVAYLSVRDMYSVGWFMIAGMCMYVLTQNKTIALVVAILGGALNRSVYVEGMTKKPKMEELKDIMNGANLEGLAQKTDKLVNNQKDLFQMVNQMGPLIKQTSEMMKQLPEGFLEHAMKKFDSRKDK
jgi:hypothetical protein